jgi:hypothetical protein
MQLITLQDSFIVIKYLKAVDIKFEDPVWYIIFYLTEGIIKKASFDSKDEAKEILNKLIEYLEKC